MKRLMTTPGTAEADVAGNGQERLYEESQAAEYPLSLLDAHR
jgi:hypothetical protein